MLSKYKALTTFRGTWRGSYSWNEERDQPPSSAQCSSKMIRMFSLYEVWHTLNLRCERRGFNAGAKELQSFTKNMKRKEFFSLSIVKISHVALGKSLHPSLFVMEG